jgi:hypothetical protein
MLFTDAQKYMAKLKLNLVDFIKAHSGIANAERVKRMKSELQLAYSLAQISYA